MKNKISLIYWIAILKGKSMTYQHAVAIANKFSRPELDRIYKIMRGI